jgi:hypothetical protein
MISHLHRSTDELKMKSATSCDVRKRDFGRKEGKREDKFCVMRLSCENTLYITRRNIIVF